MQLGSGCKSHWNGLATLLKLRQQNLDRGQVLDQIIRGKWFKVKVTLINSATSHTGHFVSYDLQEAHCFSIPTLSSSYLDFVSINC